MAHSARPRRSRFRTRMLGIAVAAALAATTVACAAGTDSSPGGDTALSFWHYYGDAESSNGKALQAFIDNFEAESGVTVDIRFIPFADFNRTLLQSAAAGDLPDVALINAFDTAAMADAGVTLDLSDRVEEWGELDAYFPTRWKTTQVDGANYGIPQVEVAYEVYIYNSL